MRRFTVCYVAALTISTAMPLAAQEAGSRPTREYVQAAGHSDAFEMLEAHTVLTQSVDPQVRAFAQEMIKDHGETSSSLMKATAQSGLAPPPMALGADQAPLLGALQGMRGQEFDRTYARQQVLAHRSALVVTQNYLATGDNPAVRQAAAAAVPVISAHLNAAEQLQATLATR